MLTVKYLITSGPAVLSVVSVVYASSSVSTADKDLTCCPVSSVSGTSSTVSTADKDLTCCPVSSVSGCRESGTASGKVKQLLTLRVVHVTHHTPEHPCDRRRERRMGKINGGREEER